MAGKDGTALFNKYHPWVNVRALLGKCLIGRLVESIEKPAETEAVLEGGSDSERPAQPQPRAGPVEMEDRPGTEGGGHDERPAQLRPGAGPGEVEDDERRRQDSADEHPDSEQLQQLVFAELEPGARSSREDGPSNPEA